MLIDHAGVCCDCLSGEVAVVTGAGRASMVGRKPPAWRWPHRERAVPRSSIPKYAAQLRRLADHLVRCEADWRGYVTDPQKLEEGIATLARRRAAVASLAAALARERSAAIA